MGQRRSALMIVDACRQSVIYYIIENKACDPSSELVCVLFDIVAERSERSGSTGPTTISQYFKR